MSGEPREVVRVADLVKDFRVGFGIRRQRILTDVSFTAHEGEIFGFIGPNGAGKTTTLKVLMGLVRPTAGSASILGRDVSDPEVRRQIGFLPENPYFHVFLTAREILDFYARLSGVEARRRADRIEELLGLVHLSHAADLRLKSFSKGMLQRVGVAQALIHDPSVVFLDEPMSGLDPIGRREIRELILGLRRAGKTVFMNTHILSDVEMICDRVAIIVKGSIRREGRVDALVGEGRFGAKVVVEGLAADAVESIETRFPDARLLGCGEHVEIELPQKEVEEMLALVLRSGGSVVSVARMHASLEDVFLDAVRRAEEPR
ncbi:MAG: ABC transporter ATP-binding protein [Myxococcota bacterium]